MLGGELKGRKVKSLLYDSSGVDDYVRGTEVGGYLGDDVRDGVLVSDVHFVELHWDTGCGVQFGGCFVSEGLLYVEECDR